MDHPRISAWIERALSHFRKNSDPNLRLQLSVAITNFYMWTGQFRAATDMVNEIQGISRSPGVSPIVLLQAKTCAAMFICVGTTSRELTLALVSEGLKIAQTNGIGLLTGPIYAAAFYIFLNTGDLKSAGEYLEKVKVVQNADLLSDFGFFYLLSALFALSRGEAASALHFAENGHKIMTEIGFPVGEVATGIALVQALHESGEHKKAVRQLTTTNRASLRINSRIFRYMGLLTEAQIAFDSGKDRYRLSGIKALREAMRIGREECFINMPGWRSAVMSKLCAKALNNDIEPEYVNHLIRVRGLIPDSSSDVSEAWPWPLKIYTLGRFSIVQNGKSLKFAAHGQGKVIELLKVIIAMGGRDVDEARTADIIWSDSEGDKAYQAFRTTLHRLRKFLGNEELILVQDGNITLNPELCWVDTWAFERYLGTSDIANIEKAGALYHGRFLEKTAVSSWVISLREHLHAKYLKSVSILGQHWETAEEWTKAVHCYLNGLSVDPLVEKFYQRLIYCHIRRGHRAEAMAVYKRCCECLQAHLNISPSFVTESMIKELH